MPPLVSPNTKLHTCFFSRLPKKGTPIAKKTYLNKVGFANFVVIKTIYCITQGPLMMPQGSLDVPRGEGGEGHPMARGASSMARG